MGGGAEGGLLGEGLEVVPPQKFKTGTVGHAIATKVNKIFQERKRK